MRDYTFTHKDESYTLVASFEAADAISKKVADPLMITRESALQNYMLEQGYPYEPKFTFDVNSIAMIFWIGLRAYSKSQGEPPMPVEKVQEIIFDMGFLTAAQHVGLYLGLIVEPQDSPHRVQLDTKFRGEAPKKP